MRIEFARLADPADAGTAQPSASVATAEWTGRDVELHVADDTARDALERILRPTPVSTDDGSYRRLGTHGDSVLQPGTLEWFRAASFARAPLEGLVARVVPSVELGAGWDPAAQYRTFEDAVERFESPEG